MAASLPNRKMTSSWVKGMASLGGDRSMFYHVSSHARRSFLSRSAP